MRTVTVHAAKTHLSELIQEACSGEEVVICRGRKPVARLVAYELPRVERVFGAMKGLLDVGDSFFEPLADEEIRAWEGE